MKKNKIIPVILSGGSGSRLWPLSRSEYPKQFLNFDSELSLFQQLIQRIKYLKLRGIEIPFTFIIANENHRFIIIDQLKKLNFKNFKLILEPTQKNTASALTMASIASKHHFNDSSIIVLPSDQKITNNFSFFNAIKKGINSLSNNNIVTFGVKPSNASTQYGYISIDNSSKNNTYSFCVKNFHEKPTKNKANEYLKLGNFFWNAGIFIVNSNVWIEMMKIFLIHNYKYCLKSWEHRTLDNLFIRPDKKFFNKLENISIDYAVLEKIKLSKFAIDMIPFDFKWSDMGSWESFSNEFPKNKNNTTIVGDVLSVESKNSHIHSTHRFVATFGINNIAVIESEDSVLVVDKSKSNDLKELINFLKKNNRKELLNSNTVFRPWGFYRIIDEESDYKIKKIIVSPYSSISLQKHRYRAEHWTIISGRADIIIGNKSFVLKKNESTFIPKNTIHRLSNSTNKNLEILEIQTGKKLEEDDIIRYSDLYGR